MSNASTNPQFPVVLNSPPSYGAILGVPHVSASSPSFNISSDASLVSEIQVSVDTIEAETDIHRRTQLLEAFIKDSYEHVKFLLSAYQRLAESPAPEAPAPEIPEYYRAANDLARLLISCQEPVVPWDPKEGRELKLAVKQYREAVRSST